MCWFETDWQSFGSPVMFMSCIKVICGCICFPFFSIFLHDVTCPFLEILLNSVEKVFHVLDHSRKNFNDGILLDNNPMTVGSV